MKVICLFFRLNVPVRLRRYRFFDIGAEHGYLDDAGMGAEVRGLAARRFMSMNDLLGQLDVKVSVAVSGVGVEVLREYAPEVLEGLRGLVDRGKVEILGSTYADSLASLRDGEEFERQVRRHSELMESVFGARPTAFFNTEAIYSDAIGAMVSALGFKAMVSEGARHVLGWRSPDLVYASAGDQRLRLLLRNYKLSDSRDVRQIHDTTGEIATLGMGYEPFDFLEHLSAGECLTATEAATQHQPVGGILSCPYPMSWAGEERDVTPWTGNELQEEALTKLYALRKKALAEGAPDVLRTWNILQNSDHFAAMSTTHPSGTNPYDAFINFMNILSDFEIQISK